MNRKARSGLLVLVFFVALVLSSCYKYNETSTSLGDYERCIARNPYHRLIFPNGALLSEQNCEFYDLYQWDGSTTPISLTYVHASFSKDTFQQELDRLQKMGVTYTEEYFCNPAYVLCLNDVGVGEYALINEEQYSIRYVFYQTNLAIEKLSTKDRVKPEYSNIEIDTPYKYQWHGTK